MRKTLIIIALLLGVLICPCVAGATTRNLTANMVGVSSTANIVEIRSLLAFPWAFSNTRVHAAQGNLQGRTAYDWNGQPPSAAFNYNDTPGSLLVANISGQLNANSLPSGEVTVTDSVGNTWHEITSGWVYYCCSNPGHYQYNSMWYAQNTNGTGTEKIAVNIGWYAGGISSFIDVEEFYSSSGSYTLDGSAYGLNQTNTGSNSGAYTLTGPSITPSVNNDLIVAFVVDDDGGGVDTWNPGSGFSFANSWYTLATTIELTQYMIQGTAAFISPTFSASFTDTNVHLTSIAAAFKLESGSTTRSLTANMTAVSSTAEGGANLLLQQSSFTYLGGFQISTGTLSGCSSAGTLTCGGNYSYGAIAYFPADNSLFVTGGLVDSGCTGSPVAEIAIPGTLSMSASYASLPVAGCIQGYSDISNGNIFNIGATGYASDGSSMFQGGLLVAGSQLLGTSGSNYDSTPNPGVGSTYGNQFLSYCLHGLTLNNTGTYLGMYGLDTFPSWSNMRFANVYLGYIPTALQSQLGGTAFGGAGGASVIGATSYGPSFTVFSPSNLGTANAGIPPPDNRGPGTTLLGIVNGVNEPAGWGIWGSTTQAVTKYFGTGDTVTSAVIPDNTHSVLFFGIHSYASCIPSGTGTTPSSPLQCAPPIGTGLTANFGGYAYKVVTTTALSEQCNNSGYEWGPICAGAPTSSVTCGGTSLATNDSCIYDPGKPAGSIIGGQYEPPSALMVWAYDVGNSDGSNTTGNSVSSNVSNSGATSGTAGNNPGRNNLTAVKLGQLYPYDLYPYAQWTITASAVPWLAITDGTQHFTATYNPSAQILYLSVDAQQTSTYSSRPVVAAFQVAIGGTGVSSDIITSIGGAIVGGVAHRVMDSKIITSKGLISGGSSYKTNRMKFLMSGGLLGGGLSPEVAIKTLAAIATDVACQQIMSAYFNSVFPTNKDLTLRLFCTNVVPSDTLTVSSLVECSGGGYSPINLTNGLWIVNRLGGIEQAIYPQQKFQFTGQLTTNTNVYGFFITDNAATPNLIGSKLINQAFTPSNNGDRILVSPVIQLSHGTPLN